MERVEGKGPGEADLKVKMDVKAYQGGGLAYCSSGWDFALQCRECGFDSWLES